MHSLGGKKIERGNEMSIQKTKLNNNNSSVCVSIFKTPLHQSHTLMHTHSLRTYGTGRVAVGSHLCVSVSRRVYINALQ